MIRWLGLSFVVVLLIGLAPPANAQMADHPYGTGCVSLTADRLDHIEPYGGFGLETMQTPIAGTVVLDRFGLVHGTPRAQPSARVTVPRPLRQGEPFRAGQRASRGSAISFRPVRSTGPAQAA